MPDGVSLDRLKERLEREPCAGAMHLLAETYYQQGLYPQAAEASRRALALYPDNPELRLILGQSLVSQGEFAEAEDILKSVAREINRLGEVFDTLRQLYGEQGREKEADLAAQLYQLLKGPLQLLLEGEESPGATPPRSSAEMERRRRHMTRTVEALEKWHGALQSQYQIG